MPQRRPRKTLKVQNEESFIFHLICNLEAVACNEYFPTPFSHGELWGSNHDGAAHVILTIIQNEAIRMSRNMGQRSLTQSYGTGGVSLLLAIQSEHRECNRR